MNNGKIENTQIELSKKNEAIENQIIDFFSITNYQSIEETLDTCLGHAIKLEGEESFRHFEIFLFLKGLIKVLDENRRNEFQSKVPELA